MVDPHPSCQPHVHTCANVIIFYYLFHTPTAPVARSPYKAIQCFPPHQRTASAPPSDSGSNGVDDRSAEAPGDDPGLECDDARDASPLRAAMSSAPLRLHLHVHVTELSGPSVPSRAGAWTENTQIARGTNMYIHI